MSAACPLSQVDEVFIFNWTKRIVLLFFIIYIYIHTYIRRTVIRFSCHRRRLIKYSSPSPEYGLTTVFYACLTMTIVICTHERSSVFMKIIIADIVEKIFFFFFYAIDVSGVSYRNKDVTVALNIPHDLTAADCIDYRHYCTRTPKRIRFAPCNYRNDTYLNKFV